MNPSPSIPPKTSRRAWFWPVVVFAAGIVVSLLVWRLAADFIGQKERERFDFRASETAAAITERIHDQRNLLRSGEALFAHSDEVSRHEWRAYVETLRLQESFPGIQGFGFSLRLSPAELPEHVRRMRAEGFTNYTVRPAGERAEYTAIIYLEPFNARNLRAFGYDMLSEPVRRAAMEEARDVDRTTLSGKVTLVQETGQDVQAGFLMYAPVYRNGLPTGTVAERRTALRGYVYSPFRAKQFLNGIFPRGIPDLHLQIFDGRQTTPESVLYASEDQDGNRLQTHAEFTTDKVIELYGHPWTLRLAATPSFCHPSEHFLPKAVLAAACSLSLLFSLLVWTQGNIRQKTRKLAHEVAERENAEAEIRQLNERLEQRIRERTAALAESEQSIRLLLNSIAEGFYGVDTQGNCTLVNRSCLRLLGYDKEEELLGRHIHELIHHTRPDGTPCPAEECRMYQALRDRTGSHVDDEVFWRRDGTSLPVEYWSYPVFRDGQVTGAVASFFDITKRKQAEEELARHRERLEQLVAERTRDLEVSRRAALSLMQDAQRQHQRVAEALAAQHVLAAQLEAANKELESFSHSVSHDLRAPLRHIHGYVEMLSRVAEGQLSDKAQRYLQTIADASQEMGHLIDDLLAFSRLGRTEMREATVALDPLVQECLRGLEMATRDRNIIWTIPPLPPVTGDRALLKQVFANLLGNAVKYTRPRDPARIEIGCVKSDEKAPSTPDTLDPSSVTPHASRLTFITFFVRDNGVGFDPQYVHKLFGVFQRLHRAEEFEGTGIGLANVRRIVVRHGGRTWAEGKLNEGATFYFTLKPGS